MLFRSGYAGLELVEEGVATLALIVHQRVFKAMDRRFDHLYARLCRENQWAAQLLRGSTWAWGRALSIAKIPYGYVYGGKGPNGLYRVGDQFAVIPSFSGDGMSIALTSGWRCADALRRGVELAASSGSWSTPAWAQEGEGPADEVAGIRTGALARRFADVSADRAGDGSHLVGAVWDLLAASGEGRVVVSYEEYGFRLSGRLRIDG